MRKLQEQGYTEKELLNVKKEANQLNDLTFLKNQSLPGPFTSKEDVAHFMDSCEESPEKIKRMYTEVRYTKACSGLGDNMNFFRLVKNGKKLTCEEYQDGLDKYFDSTKQANSMISMSDFRNVLGALEKCQIQQSSTSGPQLSRQQNPSESCSSANNPSDELMYRVGDHVAILSLDDSVHTWQLGILESLSPKVDVSFFKRKDRKGLKWVFPDETILESVDSEHIICTISNVGYECSAIITCVLTENVLHDINDRVKSMLTKAC